MSLVRVGITADWHVGSIYGLWPKGFGFDGGQWILNKGQEYLHECYHHAVDQLPYLDALIFNGDMTDGKNRKHIGRGLVTTSITTQNDACEILTRPLRRKANEIFFTAGSYYHNDPEHEEDLAKDLGAIPNDYDRHCREVLDLEIDGVVITAHHEVVKGAWTYPEGALAKARNFAQRHKDRTGVDADVLIGSHLHTYMEQKTSKKATILTPCWEIQTAYAMFKQPDAWWPDLGMIVLELDPERKRQGLCPLVNVREYFYPHPKRPIHTVRRKKWSNRLRNLRGTS